MVLLVPPSSNKIAIFVPFFTPDFPYQKIPSNPLATHTYVVTWFGFKGNLFLEIVWTVLLVPPGSNQRAIFVPFLMPDFSYQKIPLHPLATHTYPVTWFRFQVLQRQFISWNGMDSFVGASWSQEKSYIGTHFHTGLTGLSLPNNSPAPTFTSKFILCYNG